MCHSSPIIDAMTIQQANETDQAYVYRIFAEVRYEQRIVERKRARRFRPIENRVYVNSLPDKTYHAIIAALRLDEKKKGIAKRMSVPYNIVVYMWEHDL